jgi:hypothetical protein
LPLPEVAAAGLHHAAEGGAGAARAVAESHSAGPSAPALWELGEVAGNLLVMPATLPSCHLKTEIAAIVIPSHCFESTRYHLIWKEKCHSHNIRFEIKITW